MNGWNREEERTGRRGNQPSPAKCINWFRWFVLQTLRVFVVVGMLALPMSSGLGRVAVSVDLGLADIIAELRVWWEAAVARGDVVKDEATRTSAQRLAIGFIDMAGLMDTFAARLDNASKWTSRETAETDARVLQDLLARMRDTLSNIEQAIAEVDLNWAVSNLEIYDAARRLGLYRGMALDDAERFLRGQRQPNLRVTFELAEPYTFMNFDEAEIAVIAARLRQLAAQGRDVANAITETLQATEGAAAK